MAAKNRQTVNFETKKDMEAVMRAARLERRSVSSYIVNIVVPAAKAAIAKQQRDGRESTIAAD
jgi:uncharacterized protein (DUF1778 family)